MLKSHELFSVWTFLCVHISSTALYLVMVARCWRCRSCPSLHVTRTQIIIWSKTIIQKVVFSIIHTTLFALVSFECHEFCEFKLNFNASRSTPSSTLSPPTPLLRKKFKPTSLVIMRNDAQVERYKVLTAWHGKNRKKRRKQSSGHFERKMAISSYTARANQLKDF